MLTAAELRQLTDPDYIGPLIRKTQDYVLKEVRENPDVAFKSYRTEDQKALAYVDVVAENVFRKFIESKFGRERVLVLGEESLHQTHDLEHEKRVCVLLDMVDGTDLLQRDFGNWCSAVVIFVPGEGIKSSYVAVRSVINNILYFATDDEGTFRCELRSTDIRKSRTKVKKLRAAAKLHDAVVCSYGQKAFATLNLMKLPGANVKEALGQAVEQDKANKKAGSREAGFRFYNLAGNPMMARLVDGTVDIVFEAGGQLPHDVVPGAFIALQAGAHMCNWNGEQISAADLTQFLYRPSGSKISYVLGASKELAEHASAILRG